MHTHTQTTLLIMVEGDLNFDSPNKGNHEMPLN